jgi:GntR family transcriptional repressor for pyruvate dehydrogenase complex
MHWQQDQYIVWKVGPFNKTTMDLPKNQTIFRPAQVGRASEDVALQIEAAIMSGQIPMGERLPSERSLQVLFRSSRGVIREALRALKQKGMIEVKKGARGGAFVKNLEVFNASEPLAIFLKQNKVPPNLLIEFRESIDRSITLLAISRGSQQEKQTLVDRATAFEELIHAPAPDMQTVAESDRELNLLLVKMTRNPMFEMVMRTIQAERDDVTSAVPLDYETVDSQFREQTMHQDIHL